MNTNETKEMIKAFVAIETINEAIAKLEAKRNNIEIAYMQKAGINYPTYQARYIEAMRIIHSQRS